MDRRIPLGPVTSSYISAVGYDAERSILAVQFAKSGTIFHYAGVQASQLAALLEAPSVGKYYGAEIRGKFQAQRMTGPCAKCGAEGWIGERCDDCGTAVHQVVAPKASA